KRRGIQSFLHTIILVSKLRELPHPLEAMWPDHQRGGYFGVTMFPRMQIEHELDECSFQPCSPVRVENETTAGKFGGSFEVHQPQLFTKLDVRFRLKIECRF